MSESTVSLRNPFKAAFLAWIVPGLGHLYQGRFGSRLVENDRYFLELTRYIALNPSRAGLCRAPEEWLWSSYAATAGARPAPRLLDARALTEKLGSTDGYVQWVAEGVDEKHRRKIFFAAMVIFLYRATPGVGEGYRWFTIDVLGFDEAFYGTLAQIGAGLSLAGAWLFSDVITRQPIPKVLLWLTIIGAILSLPALALALRWDEWTKEMFGFGARTIALVDTTAASPFVELSMIPALTLVALNAPAGQRATWFALMASLLNLALVAGQLQTKYLNELFPVGRGDYGELGVLLIVVTAAGLLLPVGAIALFGRRV